MLKEKGDVWMNVAHLVNFTAFIFWQWASFTNSLTKAVQFSTLLILLVYLTMVVSVL